MTKAFLHFDSMRLGIRSFDWPLFSTYNIDYRSEESPNDRKIDKNNKALISQKAYLSPMRDRSKVISLLIYTADRR
jgi:hypothetical protein